LIELPRDRTGKTRRLPESREKIDSASQIDEQTDDNAIWIKYVDT
jgi:hypothetical protein